MSRRSSRGWFLAAALHLPLAPAGAAILEGRVTDAATGKDLPGATLRLVDLPVGTISGPDGGYRLWGLPGGRQVLSCSHIGYQTRSDTLDLRGGVEYRLDLALQPVAITQGQLEVTAARPEAPASGQAGALTLTAAQLRQAPAVGEPDLLRSLSLQPGVKAASDYSSGLYVRGGSPDQNAILLDQVPVYNPSHAFGFFSTFNPDAVEELSLYKGTYPATYAGNLGALLDVSTQGQAPSRIQGSAGLSLLAARLALAGPWGRGGWKVASRRTYLDPVLAAVRASGAEVPDYYFYDFNGRMDQPLGDHATFAASTYLGSDRLDFDLDQDNRLALRWSNRTLASTWKQVYSPALLGTLSWSASHYESNTALDIFATPVRFTNSVRDLSGRADLAFTGRDGHTLEAGVQVTHYKIGYAEYFNTLEPDIDLRLAPAQAGLYLQDQWRPWPLTQLTLGARASYFSAGRRFNLAPRLSLRQTVGSGLTLKLAAGQSVQYLQLVSNEGFSGGDFWLPLDGSVKPSRAGQVTLGLEWEPVPAYQLSAEVYHTRMRDLVQLESQVGENSQATRTDDLFLSGGKGAASGMEWMLQKRGGALRGWLGYTLGRTQRTFAELNAGRSFPPKYDRRHDLSLVLAWQRGAWSWESTFVYATGQAYTPAAARYSLRSPATGQSADFVLPAARNSARLLTYHRLDLGVRRTFALLGSQAELVFQVVNAYNRRNEWFIQYDTDRPDTRPKVFAMLPILPSFGLSLSF